MPVDGVTFTLGFSSARVFIRAKAITSQLRDAVADVFREHLVDQRLVADVSTARFLSERLKYARINANRD